jgi:hypothetical protein
MIVEMDVARAVRAIRSAIIRGRPGLVTIKLKMP